MFYRVAAVSGLYVPPRSFFPTSRGERVRVDGRLVWMVRGLGLVITISTMRSYITCRIGKALPRTWRACLGLFNTRVQGAGIRALHVR